MGVFRWWLMWLLSATDSSHFVSTKEKKINRKKERKNKYLNIFPQLKKLIM
jgi:hypothetical protein